MRRPAANFAQADSNEHRPISSGKNLNNFAGSCKKIDRLRRFDPGDPNEFGRIINIRICQYFTAY